MKKWGILLGLSIVLSGVLFVCSFIYAAPYVALDVQVYNVNTDQPDGGNTITWSDVVPGETQWAVADQYLVIHYACILDQGDPSDPNDDVWYNGWGLQICTDNTADDAEYKFTGTYASGPKKGELAGDFAAGLVHESGKFTLPMCWRVIAPKRFMDPDEEGYDPALDKGANLQIYETEDHHLRRNPDELYNCWIWMKDKANDGWSDPIKWGDTYFPNFSLVWEDGMLYATIVDPAGIQHAEMQFDGWGVGPLELPPQGGEPPGMYGVCVYLGAKFTNVAGGKYKTNKIYVELYHE